MLDAQEFSEKGISPCTMTTHRAGYQGRLSIDELGAQSRSPPDPSGRGGRGRAPPS
jgi:hypothetical protein